MEEAYKHISTEELSVQTLRYPNGKEVRRTFRYNGTTKEWELIKTEKV